MSELMPSWTPRWDDVRFDHPAAAEAAEACRRAARLLDDVGDASLRAAREARQDWSGRAQVAFEDRHEQWLRRCDVEIERLRHSAERIEAAAEEAQAQQLARERERDRWHAERRDLEARAATGGR